MKFHQKFQLSAYFHLILFSLSTVTMGAAPNEPVSSVPEIISAPPSFYTYPNRPTKKRNPIGRAAISFFVPGFDQWQEDQFGAAMAYSGFATLGLATALAVRGNVSLYVTSKDDKSRATQLGAQLYQTMGSLSALIAKYLTGARILI